MKGLLAPLAVGLAFMPGTAWACPSCALREAPGLGVFAAVGAMIATPYVVAWVAIRVVRRLERGP